VPGKTHFDELGEARLRAIIDDFVGRVTSDVMIGFFFAKVDTARLRELEYQHAAEHLGAPVVYVGRQLRRAHSPHRIMGGHFARRKEILRQVLVAQGVPEAIRDAWLAHVESLRGEITPDAGSECAGSASERGKDEEPGS
jgi:truncated hemoglobin YjbI